MLAPALPINEAERLEALRSYGPVEPLPDPDFDELAQLAAEMCNAPIALVTLVDEDHQWLKGRAGTDLTQTSREVSFCAHAILGTDLSAFGRHRDPRSPTIRYDADPNSVLHRRAAHQRGRFALGTVLRDAAAAGS